MRLLVVSAELPYPADHGGKVDSWNRLLALKRAGAEIHLVCWANPFIGERLDAEKKAVLDSVVASLTVFDLTRVFARPAALLRHPANAVIRLIREPEYAGLLKAAQAFRPEAVLLDQLNGGLLALRLSQQLALPLFYRSHNVEHRYVRGQLSKSRGFRNRLVGVLNLLTMRRFELRVLQAARRFFDISLTDLAFWHSQGVPHGAWLPPIVDAAKAQALSDTAQWAPQFDVGYVGNLYAPNNVAGLLWFLREVCPVLKAQRPGLRLFVAGSRPVPEIRAEVAAAGAELIESPADVVPVLRNARVLVNPVFVGSGVNIKSVEMLFTPAALVSTTVGVQGLPESAAEQFAVADDATSFALAVLGALQTSASAEEPAARRAARAHYTSDRISLMLNEMTQPPRLAPESAKPLAMRP